MLNIYLTLYYDSDPSTLFGLFGMACHSSKNLDVKVVKHLFFKMSIISAYIDVKIVKHYTCLGMLISSNREVGKRTQLGPIYV